MNKSYLSWLATREWCKNNPHKQAAIVSPDGTFVISFAPHQRLTYIFDELDDVDPEILAELSRRLLKQ